MSSAGASTLAKTPASDSEFTISDLASEFDITTRAIRFYDERGLIQSTRRSGVRIYTPAQRIKLMLILRGKRLGLSLEESRDIINMYNPGSENSKQLQFLLDKIREKRAQLERKRKEITSMLRDLNIAEQNCLDAIAQLSRPANGKLSPRTKPDSKKSAPKRLSTRQLLMPG